MAMLHIVNKSPFERNSLESCLLHAKPGATVLLIEDAVVGAAQGTVLSDRIQKALESVKLAVLGADLEARGIAQEKLVDGVNVVDYAGFVDLVTGHDNNQSWL